MVGEGAKGVVGLGNFVKSPHSHNPLHFFVVFLNFGHFFYYIPFKLTFLRSSNNYVPLSSSFHKLICVLVHLVSGLRFGLSIRDIVESYSEPNPVLYFEIARSCLTFAYMLAFKWTFWRNRSLFLSIVNDLLSLKPNYSPLSNKYLSVKGISSLICLLYCLTPVMTVLVGSGVINVLNWGPSVVLEAYGGVARHVFLLQPHTLPHPLAQFSPTDYLLTGLYVVMNFYYFLGGHLFDLTVLMGALTLRHLSMGFQRTVLSVRDPTQVKTILEEYGLLKQLSGKINKAIGFVTLCFVVEALPYYATHLDDILTLNDRYAQFRYLFYVINFFSIMISASQVTVQVGSLGDWLSKGTNCVSLPSSKLLILVTELSTNPIALKAGDIFPITYGFIATMVSVVITYAVIILQFDNSTTIRRGFS